MKGGTSQNISTAGAKPQGNNATNAGKMQPTAEQIRYAKLAQFAGHEEAKLQEKIREVSEVTGKSADVISVALHESNYDISQAIQNIIDGQYEFLDTEWQTKPTKKRKTQNPASGGDRNANENHGTEENENYEDDEISQGRSNRPLRGGRRGGRLKRSDGRPEEKPGDMDGFRDRDFKREESGDGLRSFDRGRGRSRGRARGGVQRGGSRRGGFGGGRGGSSFGNGRGAPRGRGRGFARRPRQERDNRSTPPQNDINHGGSLEDVANEEESWDIDDPKSDTEQKITEWGLEAENESKGEEWSQDQWIPPVSEDNTASLFANSIMPSSSQNEGWSTHTNGPDTSWGRTSPVQQQQQQQEESIYRPENVDTAVIMSQRAQPSAKPESYVSSSELPRPIYTTSLHNSQFPSSHPETNLTSTLLGRNYNIESLAKATMQNSAEEIVKTSISTTTMISGVHDSHKLEQEQISPPKVQRQPKAKKPARPQVPAQPVEMPKNFMEEIEQQLGGLEFGSGPSISPKFGNESNLTFGPTTTVATSVFQPRNYFRGKHEHMSQEEGYIYTSTTGINFFGSEAEHTATNMTSTIHHEAVRHSVAVPETTTNLPSVPSIPSTNSSKSDPRTDPRTDRPKTPPGLKSLQGHQSPGRHFTSTSPRDLNRMVQVQMPEPIPFPPNSRNAVPSLAVSTTLNPSSEPTLQSSLSNSYPSARSVINHDMTQSQDNTVPNIANDQRSLSSQAMIGLGESPLTSHLQQKQAGSAFSSVDAYASQNAANKTQPSLQPVTSTVFTKPNIAPPPGVLPSNSHVTYTSTTLASQVLGFSSTVSTAATQSTARTQANTSKTSASGHPNMMPMNMYAGMQQGMIPTPYTTYSYADMQVLQPRMPMNYFDYFQPGGANRENIGSNFQAGETKFARDASSPVASSINTGTLHAAHAQQQAAFLGAAAAATPLYHGYAYYPPSVIPGALNTFPVFTAPPSQMQAVKGHMGGTHYQSGYTSQHSSHAYNSAGGSQEFGKGAYHQSAAQTLPHTKTNQGAGSLAGGSLSAENTHHSGFKSQQFSPDTKGYQLTATPPSMSIQLPHGQNHMTNYPYMVQHPQHHASLMHQTTGHLGQTTGHLGHQQLETANQSSLVGRSQPHHGMTSSQQPKRETKGQGGYSSSYWSGSN